MRDIKFRAWDEKYKTMRYGGDFLNQSKLRFAFYHPEEQGLEISDSIRNLDQVMQYTGLKDKNGKEIYEGDIVLSLYEKWVGKLSDRHSEYKVRRKNIIEWCEPGAKFWVKAKIIGEWESGVYDMTSLRIDTCEVVGNVYENPELLKKEEL